MYLQKRFGLALLLIVTLASSLPFSVCARSGQGEAKAQNTEAKAKVTRILGQSGYNFTKLDEAIWKLTFKGKDGSDTDVLAIVEQDILVVFTIIAERKDLRETPAMLNKLLLLNNDIDRVKVGFNDKGTLFARIDSNIRILDVQEFKETVEQVAAATDEVFAAIKPFIAAPAKSAK